MMFEEEEIEIAHTQHLAAQEKEEQRASAAIMDFARLTEALASKSYEKIADICDDLMLQETNFSQFFITLHLQFFSRISKTWPDLSSWIRLNFHFLNRLPLRAFLFRTNGLTQSIFSATFTLMICKIIFHDSCSFSLRIMKRFFQVICLYLFSRFGLRELPICFC